MTRNAEKAREIGRKIKKKRFIYFTGRKYIKVVLDVPLYDGCPVPVGFYTRDGKCHRVSYQVNTKYDYKAVEL